jgi:pimeloyl-ACP methyl ester carboxylesterase
MSPASDQRAAGAIMAERRAVVFIHGLWLHASSWDRWVKLFGAHGYAAVAPGWPGDEPTARATRERLGPLSGGIAEVGEHYARIAEGLTGQPVLIGHGLGGLLALTLSAQTHAAGVVAIDATPAPAGQPTAGAGAAVLSRQQFHVVYGSALSSEESDRLYDRWAIPAPRWALHQVVTADMAAARPGTGTTNSSRGPVLLIASGGSRGAGPRIAGVPPVEPGLLLPASDEVVFPDRGPSLVIDNGWRLVAESCLSWMDAQEL